MSLHDWNLFLSLSCFLLFSLFVIAYCVGNVIVAGGWDAASSSGDDESITVVEVEAGRLTSEDEDEEEDGDEEEEEGSGITQVVGEYLGV